MYCSTCGNLLDAKLNYCNRCGARIDKLATTEDLTGTEYLSMATGFVGLGGLGLTVGLIAILLNYNVIPQVIVIVTLAFLSTVFGISFLMIQQISRMSKAEPSERFYNEKPNPVQLGVINTAQLEKYQQPAQSVTEHTTRTLDKIESKN
jgi:hypothetical protein